MCNCNRALQMIPRYRDCPHQSASDCHGGRSDCEEQGDLPSEYVNGEYLALSPSLLLLRLGFIFI
jgi:hypothetical protein